jgi:hypothetical protein
LAAIDRENADICFLSLNRDAISFGSVRGYDELAKIVIVILPSISSSEQLARYAGSRILLIVTLTLDSTLQSCTPLTR